GPGLRRGRERPEEAARSDPERGREEPAAEENRYHRAVRPRHRVLETGAVLDLPGHDGWLRRQGAAVSGPYLAAAGAHRSADGGQRAAGRSAPEDRHLWLPAPVHPADARRECELRGTVSGLAGGHWHHLRGVLCAAAGRYQEDGRLFERQPPRLLYPGHVRAERGGHHR